MPQKGDGNALRRFCMLCASSAMCVLAVYLPPKVYPIEMP